MTKPRRCHSRKLTLKEKFDVSYEPDPNTGCWLWLGTVVPKGYGQIQHEGKVWLAHRLSWTLHHGDIPEGQLACHKCDTPACVNPGHLFIGGYRENTNDCIAKGRYKKQRGEEVPASKLTEPEVVKIKRMLEGGYSLRDLARRFDVTRFTIIHIKKGRTWGHVT